MIGLVISADLSKPSDCSGMSGASVVARLAYTWSSFFDHQAIGLRYLVSLFVVAVVSIITVGLSPGGKRFTVF